MPFLNLLTGFDWDFFFLKSSGEIDGAKTMREDSLLLLRGFDSVGYSLSQLSQNLDNALQVLSLSLKRNWIFFSDPMEHSNFLVADLCGMEGCNLIIMPIEFVLI